MAKRFIYNEEDIKKGKEDIKNSLRQHKITEDIPLFVGWTPKFYLQENGFKQEYELDLLKLGKKSSWNDMAKRINEGQTIETQIGDEGEVVEVSPGERILARGLAGSKELFEKNKLDIEKIFDDLNQKGIEFIVYRSFRGWPAIWDNIGFYSKK